MLCAARVPLKSVSSTEPLTPRSTCQGTYIVCGNTSCCSAKSFPSLTLAGNHYADHASHAGHADHCGQVDLFWHYLNYKRTGYRRKSTITETEDVSYVSSAYVPQCLRYGGRPTLSNAHRAHESGVNTDNIRDELDEVITLNSVSIIVAEYIPFGANQVDACMTLLYTWHSHPQAACFWLASNKTPTAVHTVVRTRCTSISYS